MTKKAFKELLNRLYPISKVAYKNNQYGNTKRDYGDYLYSQDKDMFDALFQEYLNDPEKFVNDSRWQR